ncbi:methylated-DNA--[protein]-cysteine S-methyltransferase [Actinomyces faecalis]|uniref:methylated-DNA--[protein]-cysteine S-methyltransferase n=1 Tax=Actinomyces faecalis TaxID=2722820 RepID=UPI00155379B0|nr:methylated-DNA--[protein]-cysteine S-methyltransferase [Actinomyces faecalis]
MTSGASSRSMYVQAYSSPLGPMTLAAATGTGLPAAGALTGVWFDGQTHDRAGLPDDAALVSPGDDGEPAVLAAARAWLDATFAGTDPGEPPLLAPAGTDFQLRVWDQLRAIPRGQTRTYGQIATRLETVLGRPTSARAVGGAVGRNPVSVVVPCHRVLGADGALTGYAGGPERKAWLLRHEGVDGTSLAGGESLS